VNEKFEKCLVVHYGEIALKGENREWFEARLRRNLKRALKGVAFADVQRLHGRLLVRLNDDAPREKVIARLQRVFGITYFAEALRTAQDLQAIKAAAWESMRHRRFETFKVEAKRSQKSFPMNSMQLNAEVGAYLQQLSQAKVKLEEPELTCHIEIVDNYALIYAGKVDGPGGLPVGVSERAVVLLSSGIDSPVAAYKMLKRGVRLVFVHFHSYPATSRASIDNATELVRVLTQYQFRSKLYLVPFLDIQQQTMLVAPPPYRVILYRRAMMRLAEAIAQREGAQALITGENVAQVASQTLSNLRVIEEATTLPILRPLAGEDKQDIIALARRIGTYEISIEPYEDCCSLFVPRHPTTRASLEKVNAIEAELQMEPYLEKAIQGAEVKVFEM